MHIRLYTSRYITCLCNELVGSYFLKKFSYSKNKPNKNINFRKYYFNLCYIIQIQIKIYKDISCYCDCFDHIIVE